MSDMQPNSGDDREARIGQILSDYLERQLRGEAEPEALFLAQHPDLADELRLHLGTVKDLQPINARIESYITQGILRPSSDPRYLAELGAYKITGFLGRGGMGVVFKAYEESLNRTIALKLLRPELADDAIAVARFTREAKAAGTLQHSNIVTVYAVGQEGDTHYLAMEYVEGPTLESVIREHGPLSGEVTRDIFRQILSGLICAHDAGLIHRDIKSANVLLSFDPVDTEGRGTVIEEQGPKTDASNSQRSTVNAKIADFGLALMGTSQTRLTIGDSALGTPDYMSPEQARGDEQVDHRSDLYSAGVVLFEMLTGRMPFKADTPVAVVHQILHLNSPDPRTIHNDADPHLAGLAVRLLTKEPEDRFASAAETLSAMDAGESIRLLGRRKQLRSLLLPATACIVLLACGAWVIGRVTYQGNGPSTSVATESSITAVRRGEVGEGLERTILARYGDETDWKVFYEFPSTNDCVVEAPQLMLGGDDDQLIVAGTSLTWNGDVLFAFTPDSREVWRIPLESPVRSWPDCDGHNTRYLQCFQVVSARLDRTRGEEIVAIAVDFEMYPSAIFIVSPRDGTVRSVFWHYGRLYGVRCIPDFFGEGQSAIVTWGVSNKLDGFGDTPLRPYSPTMGEDLPVTDHRRVAILAILDPRSMNGIGPPRSNRVDLPSAMPFAYAFLDLPAATAENSFGESDPPKPIPDSQTAIIANVFSNEEWGNAARPGDMLLNVRQISQRESRVTLVVDRDLNCRDAVVNEGETHLRDKKQWWTRWHPIIQQGTYVDE